MAKNSKSVLTFIRAAGGLVKNENGEYLLIFRNGMWDLPKGGQDKGETLYASSLREVQEECGIITLKLGRFIAVTKHSYWMEAERVEKFDGVSDRQSVTQGVIDDNLFNIRELVFKETYWYHIYTPGRPQPTPQTGEGIERCCWCAPEEAKQRLSQSYPSLRWLFQYATEKIVDNRKVRR